MSTSFRARYFPLEASAGFGSPGAQVAVTGDDFLTAITAAFPCGVTVGRMTDPFKSNQPAESSASDVYRTCHD